MKAYQHVPIMLGDYSYPDWSHAIYWLIVCFTLVWIPCIAFYMICSRGGFQVIRQVSSPRKRWGPALPENRTGLYAPSISAAQELELEPIPTISAFEECHINNGFY